MNRTRYIFAATLYLLIACSQSPLQTGYDVPLSINLSLSDDPFVGAFDEAAVKPLGKISELVVEKVLELKPEESDSFTALDISGHKNNALLLNVMRSGTMGKAFYFNGENSYAVVKHAGQLNGAAGL